MKLYQFIAILLFTISCKGQKNSDIHELEKHLNSNFQIITYQENEFKSSVSTNLEDSTFTYLNPIGSIDGKKYSQSRYQTRLLPFKNIHPKGIFYNEERKLVKIYCRNNKPGFFNNISANNKLRWRNIDYDDDFCAFVMNKNYTKEKFEILKKIFENVILSINNEIPSSENPPIEGLSRPEYKNYRNRVLNINSNIELNKLVLPVQTVQTKPQIRNNDFHSSLRIFENEMINLISTNKVNLEGNLRGFILIDENGEIIELLQESAKGTYTAKNSNFEEYALSFKGWKPAKFNDKNVMCKVKYFIQKKDWD